MTAREDRYAAALLPTASVTALKNASTCRSSDGVSTGLIVFPLGGGTTSVYIDPVAVGDFRWRIHFEPREQEALMSSAQVHAMAAELEMSAALCDFIEAKSAEHIAATKTA